jgi:hypothetical protein
MDLYFTNGCDFDLVSEQQPIVIETRTAMDGYLTTSDYHPSYALVLLLMRWMRKMQTHYFLDSIQNCCEVMATELGHNVSNIIKS